MARTSPKQKLFTGRDHSWMQFNRRVLEEAEDPSNPLLERVKFLAITGSNLDEYVEVRQAGLMQRIEDGYREPGYDGLRPDESLAVLTAEMHSFVDAQYRCWNQNLLPELSIQGIRLLEWSELDEEAKTFAQSYFQREVDPLLTPISIDPAPSTKGNFAWHIARAFHLAGRCIGCGACAQACPVRIDLGLLNMQLARAAKKHFGYQAGVDPSVELLIGSFSQQDKEEFIG